MISQKLSKDGLLILLFHGVVRDNNYAVRNYIRKHIEVNYFRDVLSCLKSIGCCLSIDEVVDYHKKGEGYPANSFCITFDDGFENNLSVAAPVLDELGLPAIFYVTTDFIENGTMSWTDKCEYALEKTEKKSLRLPWSNQEIAIRTAEEKIDLMHELRNYIFQDCSKNPSLLTSWLYEILDMDMPLTTDDPLDKKLSWNQVKEINSHHLFSIGGHTHTHSIMSGLTPNNLDYEIDVSLGLLKDKAGIVTEHYAYPQGKANHYSKEVISALEKRGIICCPTAIDGVNYADTGLFDLYRHMVV